MRLKSSRDARESWTSPLKSRRDARESWTTPVKTLRRRLKTLRGPLNTLHRMLFTSHAMLTTRCGPAVHLYSAGVAAPDNGVGAAREAVHGARSPDDASAATGDA